MLFTRLAFHAVVSRESKIEFIIAILGMSIQTLRANIWDVLLTLTDLLYPTAVSGRVWLGQGFDWSKPENQDLNNICE